MFKKILVANRGEIALRVIRACRELGIAAVAVYSDADREALHVKAANEAYRVGPPPAAQSYLDVDRLMQVAASAKCDAVHPGYGFLAENAAFARRCTAEGLTFIGPSARAIDAMGDKIRARGAARKAKVPVVPGTLEPVRDAAAVRALGKKFGYPIVVKAAAGGGGKGLKVALRPQDVDQAVALASKEASTYFKDGTLYVEKYLARPKHVEVQILADKHGRVVHLGERDCSMQRRHQKLVEETPACIAGALRKRLRAAAVRLAESIGYDSAGTVECLVEGDEFFFLEMNARIQVEHTITEMTCGVDLVKAQIRIATGEKLWFAQDEVDPRGHSIECRINAESPARGFMPCAGTLTAYHEPGGPGVRVDSAAFAGLTIPQEYDSLLGKLIVWGQDREEARRRMLRALGEYTIEGVDTTVGFLKMLVQSDEFASGAYATPSVDEFVRARAGDLSALYSDSASVSESPPGPAAEPITVEVNDKRFVVRVHGSLGAGADARPATRRPPAFKAPKKIAHDGATVISPMHGIVAEIRVKPGDHVADGQVVAIIEAMKMMNEVVAHRSGAVASVAAEVGQTVETGATLISLRS